MSKSLFLILLFCIDLQAIENNWSSATQADDRLNQFELEFQQALEKIASLEEENDSLAKTAIATTDENRELKQENEALKKKLKLASSGDEFHCKLVPIAYVVGGITTTIFNYAKKDAQRIDSIILESIGKVITNPDIARAVVTRCPALYRWQTTCCNNTISIHINPIDLVWSSGESFYNNKYYYKDTDNAKSSGTTSNAAFALTACQLAKKLVRGIHVTLTSDPIAPIAGTTYTLITTDQLVRSILKATADEIEHVVKEKIDRNDTTNLPKHFATNLAKQMSAEAAYNIIAQTAHGVTRDSDYNYHVELLFPSDLQQRKTFLQSWTKCIIKWLLISGTPYVYQKWHPQPSV